MIQAVGKYAYIQPDKPEEETASGIVLAKKEDPRLQSGTIISLDPTYVGPLFEGDRVYFAVYAPIEVEDKGEKLVFIDQVDILGIIKE